MLFLPLFSEDTDGELWSEDNTERKKTKQDEKNRKGLPGDPHGWLLLSPASPFFPGSLGEDIFLP